MSRFFGLVLEANKSNFLGVIAGHVLGPITWYDGWHHIVCRCNKVMYKKDGGVHP